MLEVVEAGEDGGGGFGAPAGEAGEAVGGVADEGEVVGDGGGGDTELGDDTGFVADDALAAVELDDVGATDALSEILVGGADEDLLGALVVAAKGSCGRQGVVGFELDHGPGDDAEGGEGFFEQGELGEELGRGAVAGLVAGVEIVAEGFDDVVGGDAEVGGAFFDHLEHGGEDASDGGDLHALLVLHGRKGVEVAEELVGAVDEVDLHEVEG